MTAVTRAAFNNLNDRLDKSDQKLRTIDQKLEIVDHRLDRVDARLDRVDERLNQVDGRLDRVEQGLVAVRAEMREGFAENRAFFNLLLDEVRGQQRLLAEGHTTLQNRVDGHDRDLAAHDQRHGRHDLRLLRVEEHTGLPPYAESPAPGPRRRRR